MNRVSASVGALLSLSMAGGATAGELFQFGYEPGDRFQTATTIEQQLFLDEERLYSGVIDETADLIVVDKDEALGTHIVEIHSGTFAPDKPVRRRDRARVAETELPIQHTNYWQQPNGMQVVATWRFRPVLRNVPVFPERELEVGDRWNMEGIQVYDLRDYFGIEEPYQLTVSVEYEYLGERAWSGGSAPAFLIRYDVTQSEESQVEAPLYPVRATVRSEQMLYWNRGKGMPFAVEEIYTTLYDLSNDRTLRIEGKSERSWHDAEQSDAIDDSVLETVAKNLPQTSAVTVRRGNLGIVISVEDIQFDPDSANLLESELGKLGQIGRVLRQEVSDRTILLTGHVAAAGYLPGRQRISEQRAQAVADFFIEQGYLSESQLIARGVGDSQPIADNLTEEGRRRNRRVNITIIR